MFKCHKWSQISFKTERRLSANQKTWGRGGDKSRGRKEQETAEWREWWQDELKEEKKKKQVCISLFDVLFFPWSISFWGSESRRGRGGQDGIGEVKGHRCVCVRLCVRRLSAAVRRRLSLSMHGGTLVLHAVQVLLLRDGQHRGQDLIVLPVCQTWNTQVRHCSKNTTYVTDKLSLVKYLWVNMSQRQIKTFGKRWKWGPLHLQTVKRIVKVRDRNSDLTTEHDGNAGVTDKGDSGATVTLRFVKTLKLKLQLTH